MLADELDYMIGVDSHRDEHVLAVVTAPGGCCGGEEGDRRGRSRLSESDSFRRKGGGGQAGLGDRAHRQLRSGICVI